MNDYQEPADDNNLKELTRLRHAARALSDSASKALAMDTAEGVGLMLARNYTRLHQRAAELLPEDYFIETFTLELDEDLPDTQRVAQVQLMADQLGGYVKSLIREERVAAGELDELKSMGGELRDQILRMTKTTIKRALSNIELDENEDTPPDPTTAQRSSGQSVKVRVDLEDDQARSRDDDDDTPPRTV